MKDISAENLGNHMSIAVIAGRFNRFVVDQLVAGATDALVEPSILSTAAIGSAASSSLDASSASSGGAGHARARHAASARWASHASAIA